MSNLTNAMGLMRKVFDEHAKGDGKLSKPELTKLLSAEFGIQTGSNEAADKLFKGLDADGSGFVEFEEFVAFVAALATCLGK